MHVGGTQLVGGQRVPDVTLRDDTVAHSDDVEVRIDDLACAGLTAAHRVGERDRAHACQLGAAHASSSTMRGTPKRPWTGSGAAASTSSRVSPGVPMSSR